MTAASDARMGHREHAIVLVLWAALAAAFIYVHRDAVATMTLPDPDDYLRLQQVRDWLAGQAWFDINQHRVNPPGGGILHWSRVVDIPIAAGIAALTPWVGQTGAERIVAAFVPLMVMAIAMLICGAITARLVNRNWAPVAAACVPFSAVIYPQIIPMRIDHHGWQLVLALTLLWALTDETHKRRSGIIAGLASAMWLNISIEGLPIVTVAAGILGARWLFDARELSRLQAYIWTLTLAAFALETATMGFTWTAVECDRMSSPYLYAFFAASLAVAAASWRRLAADWRLRLGFGGITAICLACVFVVIGPACLRGPFADLDPYTRTLWLEFVGESRPLLLSGRGVGTFIACIGYSAFACAGAVFAILSSRGQERLRWITVLALMLPATLLMLQVARTGAVAHGFAVAGATFLGMTLLRHARSSKVLLTRVAGTVLAILAATPILLLPAIRLTAERKETASVCVVDYAALSALPPSLFLTPIDMAPKFIVRTPHSVVVTGHHRNHAAIGEVIRTFTATPQAAYRALRARHVGYVAVCTDATEIANYAQFAPNGFASHLISGRIPDWLRPLDLAPAGSGFLVFAVSNDPQADQLRGRLAADAVAPLPL